MKFPNRLGNKERIASIINSHMPAHKTYIELFFGAGGMFFNKTPVAKYNILNDLSENVYDLYEVLLDPAKSLQLKELLVKVPYHQKIFQITVPGWLDNEDQVHRAAAFAIMSSWAFRGKGNTMKLTGGAHSLKKSILANLDDVIEFIDRYDLNASTQFTCQSYDKVLPSLISKSNPDDVFVYADPPYIGTTNNYGKDNKVQGKKSGNNWCIDSFENMVKHLKSYPYKFAISERNNPDIVDIAQQYELNIIKIAEITATIGTREEILLTNYKSENKLL